MKDSHGSFTRGAARRTAAALLLAALAASPTHGQENASNPLAAVDNTDLRLQYFDLDGADRWDTWIDGAYMLTSKFKLKYELHYWDTDVSGSSENGLETFHLKPLYFPTQGELGSWKYKTAIGGEWNTGCV